MSVQDWFTSVLTSSCNVSGGECPGTGSPVALLLVVMRVVVSARNWFTIVLTSSCNVSGGVCSGLVH